MNIPQPKVDVAMNFGEHLVPIMVGVQKGPSIELSRYAGVGFYVKVNGLIATCKHIVQSVGDGEWLIAQNLITGVKSIIHNIRVHPRYDFAIAAIDHIGSTPVPTFYTGEQLLGLDVQALGFTANGKVGKDLNVGARMFKGSIVSHGTAGGEPGASSRVEVSFPSHKGFSGAPVMVGAQPIIAGMLFGNSESTIELYSYSEIDDSGTHIREKIHRVVELGLMHPASDIRQFMIDLGE